METQSNQIVPAGKEKPEIRNFSIIAHVDHGKSTLSDRIIEYCGGLNKRQMKEQVLDSLAVERRRGITVKAQTVRLEYCARNGEIYIMNLMDTPGHVDFSYEVSRCLYACEGAVLLVDASQGVEAQTLAHAYLAVERDLTIIPAINKVDIQGADIPAVQKQIEEAIGLDAKDALHVSAKQGMGVVEVLEAVVALIPAAKSPVDEPTKAILIDSWFDSYQGAVILVRVLAGRISVGQKIRLMASGYEGVVEKVGYFSPRPHLMKTIDAGDVGFVVAGIKSVDECRIGDTLVEARKPYPEPLPGFQILHPMVFCGFFPASGEDFPNLRASIERLALNDASFKYEVETSSALGMGFRCGFLGLLHLEIVRERLEEEFNQEIISTAPSVLYKIKLTNDEEMELYNPADYPDPTKIRSISEPWLQATIFTPDQYLGGIMKLLMERRGVQITLRYVAEKRAMLEYYLPLNEIVFDFHDRLKSISQGYASFDYTPLEYRAGDMVRLAILINGERVDALSTIVPATSVERRARIMCERLKELIPRQQYRVAIQAAIGGRIVARETISAFRKDVTAKCYGGDVTRKRKLLEKQKEGKKRMKQVGAINFPRSVFVEALKHDR